MANRTTMLDRAAHMRREPTETERRLWRALIDGDTHDPERDRNRDARLERETGFAVARFANRDVMTNLEGVLTALLRTLEHLPNRWPGRTTPGPSSEEEGSV
ncbi:MAG TPA: DUF559 domain-containing protein [Sphingobium sp.]|nr:DUF559 domain-containing protein [Sphingobium sp.]